MSQTQQPGPRDLIDFVVRRVACPTCHQPYRADSIHVVFHRDDQWILQADCDICETSQLVTAFDDLPYKRPGLSRHIMPSPITSEDVQQWREFLDQFTGDLVDLLIS